MKYILKRNLPFTDKGVEVKIYINTQDRFSIITDAGKLTIITVPHQDNLDFMIKQGWIEEIKPREVLIGEYRETGHRYLVNDRDTVPSEVEVFRVREVIE